MAQNITPKITTDNTSIIGSGNSTGNLEGNTTLPNSSGMILWIDTSKNIIPIYDESKTEGLLESEELKTLIRNINEETISQKVNKTGDTITGDLILQQKSDDEHSLYPEFSIRNKNAEPLFGIKYEDDGYVDGMEHAYSGDTQPPEAKITISLGDCPVILHRKFYTTNPVKSIFYLFDNNNDTKLNKVYANNGFVGDLEGNASTADTATKAVQDGDGNIISEAYIKKTNDTLNVNALYFGDSNSVYFKRMNYNALELGFASSDNPGSELSIISYGQNNGFIHPKNNNAITLGSSDKYFKNIYGTDIHATTFHGNLDGNAMNDSSGANINTRFSNLEARPTIYSSTSTPSPSSGKNGDLWVVYS